MNRRQFAKLTTWCTISSGIGLGAYWAWNHRGYVFLDNFRVIEPGKIFAGAYQHPFPLGRLIDRYQIKTVLSLREGQDGYESSELDLLDSKGVQFLKVPIPYKVSDEVRIAHIEEAISVITDARNHPVFVHCWAGCHRTGAVIAIYRVSRCGWSEEQARQELVDWGGATLGTQWPIHVLNSYTRAKLDVARTYSSVRDPHR